MITIDHRSLTGLTRLRVLVALALGAGLRAPELTGVKVGDVISDDDGADWLRVVPVNLWPVIGLSKD